MNFTFLFESDEKKLKLRNLAAYYIFFTRPVFFAYIMIKCLMHYEANSRNFDFFFILFFFLTQKHNMNFTFSFVSDEKKSKLRKVAAYDIFV